MIFQVDLDVKRGLRPQHQGSAFALLEMSHQKTGEGGQ